VPWNRLVAAGVARWAALDRDWKSVVVGTGVVAVLVALDVRLPW